MNDKRSDRRGLGRGLSALMGDVSLEQPQGGAPEARRGDARMPVEAIAPNPHQPRRRFDPEALEDLANSIREKGVIQPLIVRAKPGEAGVTHQIIAGERRWRAAQIARLHEVPVIVREMSDLEVMEVAIIENIQRADLNAIEEAEGYRELMDQYQRTQEEMAQALGKSRSHIANMLRLTQLPVDVQTFVREGKLSAGHARALITADDPSAMARQVIAKGLSVRDTEKLVKKPVGGGTTPPAKPPAKDADTRALEGDLSANIGMKVRIDADGAGESGKVVIAYKSLDDLDELCRILTAS